MRNDLPCEPPRRADDVVPLDRNHPGAAPMGAGLPERADARLAAVPTITHPSVQRVLAAAARKGVTIEVVAFDESTHTAAEAAEAVGAELGQIVKSLVFVIPTNGGIEPVLCLVAGHNRVDVARLAAVLQAPDIRRATAKEARELTGFSICGTPPIGFDRPVRVVMDPDLGRYPEVWAAAGLETTVFAVPPGTLRILADATVVPIAETVAPEPSEVAEPAQPV
jgi:prolyl-tRNA editing enzyme YbaK/EbsC (Cys-tRNA(Pro) deacylase)